MSLLLLVCTLIEIDGYSFNQARVVEGSASPITPAFPKLLAKSELSSVLAGLVQTDAKPNATVAKIFSLTLCDS